LLKEALTLADKTGVETVKLDATDQGQPLYEKLGFRSEQAVERWARPASTNVSNVRHSETPLPRDWRTADYRAFGVDRTQLLEKLAERSPSLSIGRSYLLTRPGRVTRYLGPCVAEDPGNARALIESAAQSFAADECSWDVLPKNANAVAIARALSFAPKRHLLRMVRGKDLLAEEQSIYAIAGFELG
jgi:hypothetical protein